MIDRFSSFLHKNKLLSIDQEVLLAVSGGVDSVVLLHLMSKAGVKFSIAHCNFQLRGNDSDGDEALVATLAKKFDAPFYHKHFETKKYAEEHGISTQMAARDLRYAWFQALIDENNFSKLATAHHASDQVETIIFNLTKGTGISGLSGIPIINGHIIRPLLFASKEEIQNYAMTNSLTWREDSSNESTDYHRNHLRHKVIPELKKINPGLESTMLRNSKRFVAIDQFLEAEARKVCASSLTQQQTSTFLDLKWISSYSNPEVILEKVLKPYKFTFFQVEDMLKGASLRSGATFVSEAYELVLDRERLVITPLKTQESIDISIAESEIKVKNNDIQLILSHHLKDGFNIPTESNIACLDLDKVQFPLTLRNWKEGERFYPLGMQSQKKLSDFMIDEKIPLNLKRSVLILESENNIMWVVGFRIDNRYKITKDTQRVLMITKEES